MSPGVPCAEAAAAAVEHRQCVAEKTQQRQSNRAARSALQVRGDVQGATHAGAGLADLISAQRWCVVCSLAQNRK